MGFLNFFIGLTGNESNNYVREKLIGFVNKRSFVPT